MQNILMSRPVSSPGMSGVSYAPDAMTFPLPRAQEHHADHQFVALLDSYRSSGGLARAQEVIALFKCRCGPDAATLASFIVERKVISFEWQSQTWIPLFQFNRFDMTPQPELGQVLAELGCVYDSWELASWFARPNPWISDRIPVDELVCDLPGVLLAARSDRYIANG